MDIVVKYCGGCNCQIDRSKLFRDVEKSLPRDNWITSSVKSEQHQTGLMLCGCPAACAWMPEFGAQTKKWIVAAGETVDFLEIKEDQMAEAIARMIDKMRKRGDDMT